MNYKRTVEIRRDRELITFTQSEDIIKIWKGTKRPMTVYHVNKHDSYIVMSQLSPEIMAELVGRSQVDLSEAVRHHAIIKRN